MIKLCCYGIFNNYFKSRFFFTIIVTFIQTNILLLFFFYINKKNTLEIFNHNKHKLHNINKNELILVFNLAKLE